jgi:hypothetical protein
VLLRGKYFSDRFSPTALTCLSTSVLISAPGSIVTLFTFLSSIPVALTKAGQSWKSPLPTLNPTVAPSRSCGLVLRISQAAPHSRPAHGLGQMCLSAPSLQRQVFGFDLPQTGRILPHDLFDVCVVDWLNAELPGGAFKAAHHLQADDRMRIF